LADLAMLTVTRMLEQVRALLAASANSQTVIGSSLGGFVAVNAAVHNPDRIDRLVLMAPALDFGSDRVGKLGSVGLDEWRTSGQLPVFHYGYGRIVPVHYE